MKTTIHLQVDVDHDTDYDPHDHFVWYFADDAPEPDVIDVSDMPDVVDTGQVAERLGVKRKTVETWHYDRRLLPPVDFPHLHHPLWLWSTIRQWAIDTERLGE